MLSSSDRQLRLLRNAAQAVSVGKRDEFLRNVAAHLAAEPSDTAVEAAINSQLNLIPTGADQ